MTAAFYVFVSADVSFFCYNTPMSHMSLKHKYIAIIALLLFVFLGVSAYFSSKSKETYVKEETKSDIVAKVKELPKTASNKIETSPLQAVKSESEICESSTAAALKKANTKYEPGSLFVVFNNDVTLSKAVNIIGSYNIEYSKRDNLETDFESHPWFTISVPKGQEIKWICKLKGEEDIKYTAVNELFDLHQ